jgi:hypothetical protein
LAALALFLLFGYLAVFITVGIGLEIVATFFIPLLGVVAVWAIAVVTIITADEFDLLRAAGRVVVMAAGAVIVTRSVVAMSAAAGITAAGRAHAIPYPIVRTAVVTGTRAVVARTVAAAIATAVMAVACVARVCGNAGRQHAQQKR